MTNDNGTPAVEELELTGKQFQALLSMTGDPGSYTAKTTSLVRALHKAQLVGNNNQWRVRLTEDNIRAAVFFLEGYCLNRPPSMRTRIYNSLCKKSAAFKRAFDEFQGKA